MKSSGIGGQAVLEGIMMKNKDTYSVAVRKPDHEIAVVVNEHKSITRGVKVLNLPFIRGVFNFIDSLVLGIKTLMISADYMEDDEEVEKAAAEGEQREENTKEKKENGDGFLMGLTVFISLIFAIALFMILPKVLADLLGKILRNNAAWLISVAEGVLRLLIFLGYILLISRMKDIQRTFMYHGAEHKCINCIENGEQLTVENVMKSSRLHRRCGTSFLLFVMIISIIIFMFVTIQHPVLKYVVRLLLVPVIAGISYEVLRLAGNSDAWIVRVISAPGMCLQRVTTKEPDAEMVEVAIKAVEAVFDWKSYVAKESES